MSGEEYTPTTAEVRDHWVNVGFAGDGESFDRWLAAHDAATQAAARETIALGGVIATPTEHAAEGIITDTMVAAGAAAVMDTHWRFRDEPLALASAHSEHLYDYACAVCRPDLDDGAQRLARAVLEAALAAPEADAT